MKSAGIHQVEQHRTTVPGVEAMTLLTDRCFPRHAHDQFGIGILVAGGQRSWSGRGQVEARAGDLIAVNPGETHDGLAVDGEAREWRMLYLDPALVGREVSDVLPGEAELALPVMEDPELAGLFLHLFAVVTAERPDVLAVEEALLRTILHALRRHGGKPITKQGATPPVAQACRHIDAAPERSVTLAELAALSGVSRFQLLRGFAREVGITPHAYVVQQRVRLARRFLAAGMPLAEAALATGFADQSHLTRAFGRQFGVTPARYRAART